MFIKKSGVLQILLGLSIKLIVLSENAYASSAILRRSIVLRRGFSILILQLDLDLDPPNSPSPIII